MLHFRRRNPFAVGGRIQTGGLSRIVQFRGVGTGCRVGGEIDVDNFFRIRVDDGNKVKWMRILVFVLFKPGEH